MDVFSRMRFDGEKEVRRLRSLFIPDGRTKGVKGGCKMGATIHMTFLCRAIDKKSRHQGMKIARLIGDIKHTLEYIKATERKE